jgi:hypothetical protein
MSGFIEGEDRNQATLFPERLDDYIAEDSAVREIRKTPPQDGSFEETYISNDRLQ